MAVQVNFLIDQGTSFRAVVIVQNEDGTLFDLTGWSAFSQMRKHYKSVLATDITVSVIGDPLVGEIEMILEATDTNPLSGGRYIYDIELFNTTTSKTRRAVQGIITLSPQSTKLP